MLLEVTIRRNFGERYFQAATAVSITVLLAVLPMFLTGATSSFGGHISMSDFLERFLTWYIYLVVFMYYASLRQDEIKRLPGVFDFARFSLSKGIIHPRFRNFVFNGQRLDERTIATVVEPAFFFFIGLFLMLIGQPIGYVLLISSLFYSFSYVADYHAGDNYLMDKIDEQICNEELVKTFVDDAEPAHSRGFNFYGRRPADTDARRRVAEMFQTDEETVEAF
ncbi:hypothetical protein CWM47_10140 [Spirosoma pollinicola]|uniref:Uncharacterized protein n=2 Tax=Spirosoma pollinicola TaxID=2057025 RepID=A0A2K8YX21_9BACT|nr:hypothetical protein CWM47_10140 [Spirosoma pollinicola]